MTSLLSVAVALGLVFGLIGWAAPAAAGQDHPAALQAALDAFAPKVRAQGVGEPGHGPSGQLATLAAARADLDGDAGLLADALLARPTDDDGVAAPTVRYDSTPAHVDSASFRIHYATDGQHEASAGFARTVADVMEQTRRRQVDELGWLPPASDQGKGGDDRTDVYLADIAGFGFLGYAATDPGQVCTDAACGGFHGYLVLDNDFATWQRPEEILRVVAAHELNHLLQFRYSVLAETWWMEATAEWMAVHTEPTIDYSSSRLRHWGAHTQTPLTDASAATGGAAKSYGSYVWNAWLASRHGAATVRRAWELTAGDFSIQAYDQALAEAASSFSDEFLAFATATAAWPTSGIPGAATFPDVTRTAVLTSEAAVDLDHTAFALYDVPARGATTVTLSGPAEVSAGVGVVIEREDGQVETVTRHLRTGSATVDVDTTGAERVTVTVANTDASWVAGEPVWDRSLWRFPSDGAAFTVTVVSAARAASSHGSEPSRVDGGGSTDAVGQAIATSRHLFPDGSVDRVVLATADRFPDALAGAVLAGARAPILFTRGTGDLEPRTAAEIVRVTGGTGQVLVLGGTAAVSDAAAQQASRAAGDIGCAAPLPITCRFAGTGREHTAALVAEAALAERPGRRVLVARSDDFADAITGGAYAAATGTPLLLTPRTSASPHTAELISRLGVEEVVVLGGQAAVTDAVLAALPAPRKVRVSGADRTATAAQIARVLWAGAGRGHGGALLVNVRSEAGWPTALAAAVASAVLDAPQYGVENAPQALTTATIEALQAQPARAVQAFGDAALVGEAQLSAAIAASR